MSNSKRQNKSAAPLGIVIILLALVGAGCLAVLGFRGIRSIADNTKTRLEYQKMLTHVVMYDPDPFDDINDANFSQLIDCAIWELLGSDVSTNDLHYDESGRIILTQESVETSFASLFGTEVSIADKHATIEGYGYEFIYSETRRSYLVPVTGIMPLFTPKVVDVDKSKNSVVLTVGYLASGDWQQDDEGNFVEPVPDKYMKITVREKDGKEYVSAIQVADASAVAETPENTSPVIMQTTGQSVIEQLSGAQTTVSETTAAQDAESESTQESTQESE